MDLRKNLYELLLKSGISIEEIERRKDLEKDYFIHLYNILLDFNTSEIQYIYNRLKDCEKLGTFICLKPFILFHKGKNISYWDNLKLILEDNYWKNHPFTINYLDMYYDLSEEERIKYIKMLLEANKDPLGDNETKPHTDRIQPLTQDYFDVYKMIGKLDTYKKENISLYHSLQVENYQVAYYIHQETIESQSSKKVIDSLVEEIFKSMSVEELNKTSEFNKEKGILSYIGHKKTHEGVYEPSMQYIKSKR